ncbi:DUF1320 family protein [Dysgonomonas sp. Marseille-P4677]|uniref:phage protein Gp36 family protein n=1 Tax=Dysgonomonas sp. Marseille-P4677 TaxID=2364790 RepID=UPI001A58CF45|nr:phage protein Gp36 family protein [Dysgonomonas sp. Marseille-P4677]MBK5719782.1 DUF1320 family protein [Dysgonomonas sp. Marseille-P4677]
MFITIQELQTVMYNYQIIEITEHNDDIALQAIDAAIEEVRSYLAPNNKKEFDDGRPLYDVDKIFEATGNDRNALIVRYCLSIAAWYICELANVDIIHEQVKERYDRAIAWLKSVVKGDANPRLPILNTDNNGEAGSSKKPFRYGSRPKFNHEGDNETYFNKRN